MRIVCRTCFGVPIDVGQGFLDDAERANYFTLAEGRGGTSDAFEGHRRGESDAQSCVHADGVFQDCGAVRRAFCLVELSSKVDATRSVAVLASGLLAVRMANAVVGHTTHSASEPH
jgi:hypothetical protein